MVKKAKFIFWSISLLFSSCLKVRGQEVVDTATIKCTYKLVYAMDSSYPDKTSSDILSLLIGKRYSHFFSYITYAADSAFKVDIEGGKISPDELLNNKSLHKTYTSGGFYSQSNLYIDNSEKKIIITDKINNITKYIYEERKEQIDWKILPDTSSFLKYLCQKAVTTFRGRTYTAWFTSEIPIDAGPYKFNGLPGLIIKVADVKNNYSFECIGVEQLNIKQPISIDKKGCIQTTRSEFRKAFQVMFDSPWESITNGTGATIGGRDADKLKIMLSKGIPYNPIELD